MEQSKTIQIEPTRVYWEVDKAFKEGYNIISAQGGSRSGKTYNIMIWICVQAWNHKKLKVSIVRATMPTLKSTVYEDFKDIMEKMGRWDALKKNVKDMVFRTPSGSTFKFFATEEEQKARGMKANITFVNEATEVEHTVYDQLKMRTESKQKGKDGYDFHRTVILDYNPTFPNDHWLTDLNINPVYDDTRYFFKTTYKDNPYLAADQIREIELFQTTDKRMWKIYGLGEQCMAEGLVFENYYIADKIPDHLMPRAIVGVDWGYKDPFAVVLVAIDNRNREIYLKEICYKKQLSEDEIMAVFHQEILRGRVFIPDPRDPAKIARMRREGLRVRLPKSFGRSSIIPGIQKMKSYKIFITADSPNGLKEADNYTYEKDRNGNWTDEPNKKNFNHFWDAARYVVATEGVTLLGTLRRGITIHR